MHHLIALASLLTLPLVAEAQAEVRVTEWPVPWENTRPRDPFVARDGSVWFVGQTGHYVARFDPATAEFKRFDLEPGTGPHNLIVDGDGIVWYAGNRAAHIGRLDPVTGQIRKYAIPDTAARDPHTLVFDQQGNIWFTAQQSGFIGRFSPATGEFRYMRVSAQNARPYGIALDASGRVWFNQFGIAKLGMLDPGSFSISDYELPDPRARGRRVAVTADGAVWYVDYVRGKLSRLDPATRAIEEFDAPAGEASMPYALAVDDRDRLWYVETGPKPNRIVGFDARTRRIVATAAIQSGGGAVRHMVYHAPTNSIWFGTDAGTIGRAELP